MKNILKILILSIVIFSSCDNNEDKKIRDNRNSLPNATGKAGEVVVVLDDNIWEGQVGQTLWDFLGEAYPQIPQVEPRFDVVQIPPSAFSRIFKTHRNLIFFEIDPGFEKPMLSVNSDKWAYPQVVITLKGKSFSDIKRFIEGRGDKIVEVIENAERERIVDNYRKHLSKTLYPYLKENHQVKLFIPSIYSLDVEEEDFMWISHETAHIIQGLFIYKYPYTDEKQFDMNYLLNKRNEYLKKYVPGPNKGSYMTTVQDVVPDYKRFTLNGNFIAEIRGLWKVQNGFMGGPFVMYATVHPETQEIYVVEGFVFAPQFKKRNYIRQVEAILSSINFIKADEVDNKKGRPGKGEK